MAGRRSKRTIVRRGRRPSRLTPTQRKVYADMLESGVPAEVITEFDGEADALHRLVQGGAACALHASTPCQARGLWVRLPD